MAAREWVVIIPVMDVMNGVVVHAKAGQRQTYQPIVSQLTTSTEPTAVYRALIENTRAPFCYVADLDAIENRSNDVSQALKSFLDQVDGRIWLDLGIESASHVESVRRWDHVVTVIGTESISGIEDALKCLGQLGPERSVLSLDFFHSKWTHEISADTWVSEWQRHGGRNVIWLDIGAVGMGQSRLNFRAEWKKRPEIRHFVGGGVSSYTDVEAHLNAGAAGVFVASALHDGRLRFDL